MYRVMIVEDEMFVRLGIKMSVDWMKLGMEVIADVANGKAAWEVYEREKPDIVLTDIKMPVMDGMELIRRIRENDQDTRILILSCLEEFPVVREAISMNVSDYILKLTMTQEDLEKVFLKVKTELELIRGRARHNSQISIEEKKKFLLDYFYYDTCNPKLFPTQWERLELPFSEKNMMMALLEIDDYESVQKRFRDEYGLLVSSAFSNVLSEVMGEYGNGILIEEKERRFILIVDHENTKQKAEGEQHFYAFLGRIKKTFSLYFQTSVTFGVSQLLDGYENLRKMYQQCSICLEQKFYHHLGEILIFSSVKKENVIEYIKNYLPILLQGEGDIVCADDLLSVGIELFEKNPVPATLVAFFKNMMTQEINQVAMEGAKRIALNAEYMQQMEKAENLEQLVECYKELYYRLYKNPNAQSLGKTVSAIMHYIRRNYDKNIPLEQIAEAVELSPNYICSLFKKETGVNLFQYIMDYRIKKAKELLLSTNLKSYEIAEKTGFTDESYFSRCFKKKTGMSPVEFRNGVFYREEE